MIQVVHRGECMCKEREREKALAKAGGGETARRRSAAVLRDSVAASRPRGLELLLLLSIQQHGTGETGGGDDSKWEQHMFSRVSGEHAAQQYYSAIRVKKDKKTWISDMQ